MSGSESTTAAIGIHHASPNTRIWMTMSAIVDSTTPIATHRSGNSSDPTDPRDRFLNVRTSVRHFSASAVSPAQMIMEMPGHMTQRKTSFLLALATRWFSIRKCGAITQDRTVPMNIPVVIRIPMMIPDPIASRSSDNPAPTLANVSPKRPGQMVSGTRYPPHSVWTHKSAPDTTSPIPSAAAGLRASGPRESSTMIVSAAATPSAYVSFSSTT
jgi:hypothetical protein